jgi:SAM-dependent methyltransferase
MDQFYEDFYRMAAHSSVHAEFCERVFGKNLCQHGFADMAQLSLLMTVLQLNRNHHVLEVGCGNGMIAEYISDCTGAHFTGIDNSRTAILHASQRTAAKADRLTFLFGDINALSLSTRAYDVLISIDSLYFSTDYAYTIRHFRQALRPGGQMAILFTHDRAPWVPKEQFRAESVQADRTPLADSLKANGLSFNTYDLSREDYRLALLRKQVLSELRPRFEAENLMFIYENRMGDATGMSQAFEEGLLGRYLYHVRLPNSLPFLDTS